MALPMDNPKSHPDRGPCQIQHAGGGKRSRLRISVCEFFLGALGSECLIPPRHVLGATLLHASRFTQAEIVYRDDLNRNPATGWSLFGLGQSLRREGKKVESLRIRAISRPGNTPFFASHPRLLLTTTRHQSRLWVGCDADQGEFIGLHEIQVPCHLMTQADSLR